MTDMQERITLDRCADCAYRVCWNKPCTRARIWEEMSAGRDAQTSAQLPDQPPQKVIEMQEPNRVSLARATRVRLTRDVAPAECPWLEGTVTIDTIVWLFDGATYGCIQPTGVACSLTGPHENPFFELPLAALEILD